MIIKVFDVEDSCEKGLNYLLGDGVEKNFEKAKQYFEEASTGGSSRALFCLGDMYFWGYIKSNEKKP